MKTIFVPSQRTRSPSHNCQSCNKSLCGTNEYGIGNETKLIGMLCQLDSIHPPFHTRPFICEVVWGCLSLSLSLSLSPPPLQLTRMLSPSLSISHTHTHTRKHTRTLLMWKLQRVNVCGHFSQGLLYYHNHVYFHRERVSLYLLHYCGITRNIYYNTPLLRQWHQLRLTT